MTRNERRQKKYKQLRDAGYTYKEATELKDLNFESIKELCEVKEYENKLRETFFKEANEKLKEALKKRDVNHES